MKNGKYYESDYEEAFVELLHRSGWDYTYGDNIHRKFTDVLIENDMRAYFSKKCSEANLSDNEQTAIIANLRNTGEINQYYTLRSVFTLYRDGYNFNRMESDDSLYINYIDFIHPENNIYRCVNQYTIAYKGDEKVRIPDVLLFINGIPVCIIELKNPTNYSASIADAYDQIHVRYKRDIPHLMKFCVLSCISDGSNSRLGTTYTPYEYYYAWKKIDNEDKAAKNGIQELETLIAGAFEPLRLTAILRDFVYFPDVKANKEEAIVCRYPQFFATMKLLDNIKLHVKSNGGDGKGGTYFGATGCGKTYTMVFLARQLALRCKNLGSPTIILIVDREDLQEQSGKLFVNSSDFLMNGEVAVISDRTNLFNELSVRNSGGVFICTIQKFCEETGLLSNRSNVICFSDEAHRTQTNTDSNLKIVTQSKDDNKAIAECAKLGAFISYGFAKYLRDAFPNATYVGFTGTPIDETIHVFGSIVDSYTMKQSVADGITLDIKYIPRLARVTMNEEKAREIEEYYRLCADESASAEDVKKSKEAMSSLNVILGDEKRLHRLAVDIADHYDTMSADNPDLIQKAMVVCSERLIAYKFYLKLKEVRPEWFVPKKAECEEELTRNELEKLKELPMVNLVATCAANDPKEMYDLLGDKSYRQMLDTQFKLEKSNFRIAIVVDMWITGFDIPCLSVLYNDKPLQKHTLIQTISRVNRKYKTKEYGLIVDYIGIRENMQQAMKQYGGDDIGVSDDDIKIAKEALLNELQILKDLMHDFDFSPFFGNNALERLICIQNAAEFVLAQVLSSGDGEKKHPSFLTMFTAHVKRLRTAYNICHPAGVLNDQETVWSQCLMGICSFVSKMTSGQHDTESMNRAVEQMVKEAISCSNVENIINSDQEEDIFSDEFIKELEDVKLPNTKFQLLVKMLRKVITEYKHTNKTAAERFEKMLEYTIEEYNTRDKIVFGNAAVDETVTNIQKMVDDKVMSLADKLLHIFKGLNKDKEEFKNLGITFEEKAFYDILVELRDKHGFEYPDNQCIALSKEIKNLIDGTSIYADWLNNDNLKRDLSYNLAIMLHKNGYPPTWSDEVFNKVMDQVANFKTYR